MSPLGRGTVLAVHTMPANFVRFIRLYATEIWIGILNCRFSTRCSLTFNPQF